MKCSTQGCFGRPATYMAYVTGAEEFKNVIFMVCILCATTAQGKGAKIRRIDKEV